MRLTKDDPRVGTINEDGRYIYPSLTISGQAFNRGGGYSTRRLDSSHFIVYVGQLNEVVTLSKPEVNKEDAKSKRKASDDSKES